MPQFHLSKPSPYFLLTAVFIVCALPICYRMDFPVIEQWDESRNVANTLEMLKNGNYLTRYYQGKPDMYELKPPFLIWLQTICVNCLGYTELALRLPATIFSLLTVGLLFRISKNVLDSYIPGILAAMILVTSMGYIGKHAARNGEHDAILAFFTTLMVYSWFQFLQSENRKFFWLFCIAVFFTWFTKSISGLVFLPSLFLFGLLYKPSLIQKSLAVFTLGICLVLFPIAAYYLMRNAHSPGYVQAVWDGEWFGRYFKPYRAAQSANTGFIYYLLGFDKRFYPYHFLIWPALLATLFKINAIVKKWLLFLLIQSAWFLLVISLGDKNYWYDVPLYPLLALILSCSIWLIIQQMPMGFRLGSWGLLLILFIVFPYSRSMKYVLADRGPQTEVGNLCRFLKSTGHELKHNITVVPSAYETPLFLYQKQHELRGYKLRISSPDSLKQGEYVLLSNQDVLNSVNSKWTWEKIQSANKCLFVKLKALKQQTRFE